MQINSTTLSFNDQDARLADQSMLPEDDAISLLKQFDQWEEHQEECERRFEETQNWTRLMSLVQIYEFWEGDYRNSLFAQLNMNQNDIAPKISKPKLCCNRFGDLRHIRNKFLHSRGVFSDDEPGDLFNSIKGLFKKDEEMLLPAVAYNKLRRAILEDVSLFPKTYFLIGKQT